MIALWGSVIGRTSVMGASRGASPDSGRGRRRAFTAAAEQAVALGRLLYNPRRRRGSFMAAAKEAVTLGFLVDRDRLHNVVVRSAATE